MLTLSAAEIAARLPWPRLIDALAAGLARDGTLAITSPPRHYHHPEASNDILLIMPAWNDRFMGIKAAGIFPDNPARGAEFVAEAYLLIDRHSGRVVALLDGIELTNRRTAAASALAARSLARADAETLLVIGTGSLARHAAAAHAAVRPYRRILVWGRNPERAAAMAHELAGLGLPAQAAADLAAAAGAADVITCVTSSATPVLRGAWLRPGTHVDLIGAHQPTAREADSDVIAGALLYADVRANVLREAGDILIPIAEGRITADAIRGELADLVAGPPAGGRPPDAITLFKSVGFAAEDMIAAIAALGPDIPAHGGKTA